MNDIVPTPWHGNWQLRLQNKVESLGFKTFEEFLIAHPGVGYIQLVKILDDANVCAMQLYDMQMSDAERRNDLRKAAIDALARFFAGNNKRGWGKGMHASFRAASAIGDWIVVVSRASKAEDIKDELRSVANAIKDQSPPLGWVPKGPDDEILQKAFEVGWPEP